MYIVLNSNMLVRRWSSCAMVMKKERAIAMYSNMIAILTILYVPLYMIIQDDHFLVSMIILQLQSVLYNIDIVSILFQHAGKEIVI